LETDMHRYTTKHDNDLSLGDVHSATTESCPCSVTLREWLAVLNERLQHVTRSVRELADRMNLYDGQHADVSGRLGGVEGRLGTVETRFGAVETRLGAVESRLGAVESRLGAVEGRLGVVEERLGHTATKAWVLGCAVALLIGMLTGTLGGFWWIVQQYIGPLLRATAS
jgi:hypothetical protein